MERVKAGTYSYTGLLAICCGVVFAGYLTSYMRMPVVPLYAKALGAGTTEVGLINAAFLLMAGTLSFPLGLLSDRLGRKLLVTTGIFLLACTSFLLYLSTTPNQVMGIYVLFGIGLAAFAPTMMSFVADFSPPSHLGRSYGWYTTALYGGTSLGPALGGVVAQHSGYDAVFLASGAALLLVLGLCVLFMPPAEAVLGVRSPQEARRGVAFIRAALGNRPLLACWLSALVGCFALGMTITFLPLHAHAQGLKVREIGFVFAFQGICNALSRIPFGYLSDRVARRSNLVLVGFVGFALSMVAYARASDLLGFLGAGGVFGTSMGLAFSSVGALIAEAVPAESRGLAMGGYNTCIYFGMMSSSALMGPVIERIGFGNGFLLASGANFLVMGAFYWLLKGFVPSRRP